MSAAKMSNRKTCHADPSLGHKGVSAH